MATEPVILDIIVNGAPAAVARLDSTSAATTRLRRSTEETGVTMERTAKRGFLMNQMLFTMRRLLYMTTLAIIAGGIEFIHWGFQFNSAMQQGRVSLTKFTGSTTAANKELDHLFNLAAYSPFQFQDLIKAASTMYAFQFSTRQVNVTMQTLLDALTATGRATPAGLNRVSTALGHMMSIGHVTGQVLLQLARDGIPGVYESMQKYFNLSPQQLAHIGALGIPAPLALAAINQYVGARYRGFAKTMQESTLHGVFTTFKDFMSQIMGDIEQKPFKAFQNLFNRINPALVRMRAGFKKAGFAGMWEGLTQGHPTGVETDIARIAIALQHLWNIMTRAVIPAFKFWFNVLKPLEGILYLLDGALGFLQRNMWLTKIIAVILVYQFILLRLRAIALFFILNAAKLFYFTIALWNLNVALLRAVFLFALAALRIALFAAAIVAYLIVVGLITIAQWAWNAALVAFEVLEIATGIFLIVAAVSALVIGIRELIIHWHDIVTWIKHNWVGIGAILGGPFIGMAYVTYLIFERLKRYVAGAYDWIKKKAQEAWGWIKRIINPFGIFSAVGRAFSGGGSGSGSIPISHGPTLPAFPNNGAKPFIQGANQNGLITVHNEVVLQVDGKKMAQVVADHKNDVRANQ